MIKCNVTNCHSYNQDLSDLFVKNHCEANGNVLECPEYIKFNNSKNELIEVSSCYSCPLCHWYERGTEYQPHCSKIDDQLLDETMNENVFEGSKFILDNCPLKNGTIKIQLKE